MKKRGTEIMGISETHWRGQGKVVQQEGKPSYTQVEKTTSTGEGVGILMSKSATRALLDWMPVNERIIVSRFHSKHIKLTMVHVYAPTEDAEELVKDEFYRRLQDVVNAKEHDMLIVTGDMNAKVGEGNWGYERVVGKHGIGRQNDNGERLCDFCCMNELVITGTLFPHKVIHKAIWESPDRKTQKSNRPCAH